MEMVTNGVPYEEYKGFYIAKGVTMPAQGIFEWNVYASVADVAGEAPLHTLGSKDAAMQWIDGYREEHGTAAPISEEEAELYKIGFDHEKLLQFMDFLDESISEKAGSREKYYNWSESAYYAGRPDIAQKLEKITENEHNHMVMLIEIRKLVGG